MDLAALASLRDRIDAIDRQILALFAARQTVVVEVAAAKLAAASPIRDREREERLLLRLRSHAAELGLDPHEIERLYRVVLDMSVASQEASIRARDDAPLRVTYQGVEGSYSHLAAQARYAGRDGGALLTGCDSFRAAADAVRAGAADLALLPIENSTAGSINETYDLLADHGVAGAAGELHITGEVIHEIEHCLLALPGVSLAELRVIRSHPQALAQCAALFAAHPRLIATADIDTAGSAQRIAADGDRTAGAIASAAAAARYGLAIVARGVQTIRGNATRFVEISPRPAPVADGAAAKTSLIVELADRPGALGDVLVRFAAHQLSLTKLESRPIASAPWTYRFYVDVLGHAASAPMQAALAEIRPLTRELRVLGTYAAAPLA